MRLKGVHRVVSHGRTYYYAWRGGPALDADPSDAVAFAAAFNAAHEAARRVPAEGTTVAAIVLRYRQSPEFLGLSPHWRTQRNRWLNEIVEEFGEDDVSLFEDRRSRRAVIEWRDKVASSPASRRGRKRTDGDGQSPEARASARPEGPANVSERNSPEGLHFNPRKADIAVASLNALLNWALDRGEIAVNVANGVKKLYTATRADIIIEPDELAAAMRCAPKIDQRLAHGLALAADTGLARGDIVKLAWSGVGENSIAARRGKTKILCAIPILDGARAALAALPRCATTVLTDENGRPWTPVGFGKAAAKAFALAGVDKHLHDARGTFITRMKLAEFPVPVIADAAGWSGADGERRVSRIIDRYVDRDRIARERIAKMEKAK